MGPLQLLQREVEDIRTQVRHTISPKSLFVGLNIFKIQK